MIERRKYDRPPLMIEGEISVGVDVLNITSAGAKVCMKETEVRLETDLVNYVVLYIPSFGEFAGEIIWKTEAFIGIHFHDSHKTMMKLVFEGVGKTPNTPIGDILVTNMPPGATLSFKMVGQSAMLPAY